MARRAIGPTRLAVAREAGALPEIKCDFSPLEILN